MLESSQLSMLKTHISTYALMLESSQLSMLKIHISTIMPEIIDKVYYM